MPNSVRRGRSMALAAGVLGLMLMPAGAGAATVTPAVVTKAPSNIAQTTAYLNGSVDPNGLQTSYFFQYGPTSLYGGQTPETGAGKGTSPRNVSAPVVGLAPATTYHFRIVARDEKGHIVKGKDRTFKTRRQPLGLVLNASQNPVAFNASTLVTGSLTGTGNAGQTVQLQNNPWPYAAGFTNVGNAVVTDANGAFAFPLLGLQVNTQYRVLMPDRPTVVSPIVSLGVKVGVHSKATPRRVRKGSRVRFSGTIVPAADGSRILVQRRSRGTWRTVATGTAAYLDGSSSRYRRRVRIRHSGAYRVYVDVRDGAHVANAGRTFHIRLKRR